MIKRGLFLCVLVVLAGCGAEGPAAEDEVGKAAGQVQDALDGMAAMIRAVDILRLLPSDTCGQPERAKLARIAGQLDQELGCAVVVNGHDETSDEYRLDLPADGCELDGRPVEGSLILRLNAGDDRRDVAADLSELKLEGHALPAAGGYGECGDQKTYWVELSGRLPKKRVERGYGLKGSFQHVPGLPVLGGDVFAADVSGVISTPGGQNAVTLSGKLLDTLLVTIPQRVLVDVQTEDGHHVHAAVQAERLDESFLDAELQLDGGEPVKVAIGL